MGTGYTRNDTSNNIADGNVVNASDLDGEFDAVESAFATSGHTHDGTAAEGGPVTVVGPAQDVVVSSTNVNPKTTNTLDLGTASLKYKDAYFQGNITVDGTVGAGDIATGDATFSGDVTVQGSSVSNNTDHTSAIAFAEGSNPATATIVGKRGASFDDGDISFRTMKANTMSEVLLLDEDKNATFAGDVAVAKNAASDNAYLVVQNTNTGADAGAEITISTDGAATTTSDPRVRFNISGATNWTVGVDNSDSDAFKIGYNSTVGTSTALTLANTTGDATFAGDVGAGAGFETNPFGAAGVHEDLSIVSSGASSQGNLNIGTDVTSATTMGTLNFGTTGTFLSKLSGAITSRKIDTDTVHAMSDMGFFVNKTTGLSETFTLNNDGSATFAGDVTMANLTSTGIDDNATSTALTIDSSENATFAGDVTATRSSTGSVVSKLQNTSNTASASALHIIETAGTNAGNPYTRYRVVSGRDWVVGIDRSDGYKFKISDSSALGTNDAFTINPTTLNATFAGDVSVGGISLDNSADKVFVGDGTNASTALVLNSTATGSPFVQFEQAGTFKAYMQWSNSDTALTSYSTSDIVFKSGGFTALTLDSSQDATFAGDVTVSGATLTGATASTGGLVQVKSSKNGTWSAGEILGTFGVYTADGSSSGAGLAGKIDVVASLSGSGSFNDMVFYSRDGSGLNESLRLDYLQNATFAGQVIIGTSGVATTSGDDLIVGKTDANNYGLTIKSGPANSGNIFFGDDDVTTVASRVGRIEYNHADNSMAFNTNSQTALTLDSSRNATFAGDINFSGSAPNVLLDADNDRLVVSGGDATSSGANIIFYGDNHASNANKMIFRNSGTTALTINASQDATFAGDVTLSNSATPTLTLTDTTNTCTLRAQSGNSSAQIGTSTAHSFGVQTDGTNALTIDTSQNATFAGTVNFYGIRSNTAGSGAYATHIGGGGTWKFRVATSGSSLNWDWENVLKARMLTSGDWQNVNNSYGAISDRTLKQDITDARSQWDDIKAIQLRNFRYINEVEADENAKEHLGVIAQEVQEVSAGLVTQSSEEDHLGVNYMLMCIKAVGALQEAMTKIEDLEARVATLESAE